MKRKDLTPGMVVEARSGKAGGLYTTYDRAIVLSHDPWETRKSTWLTRNQSRHVPAHDPRAKGVPIAREVSTWTPDGPVKSWIPDVAQPGQLVPTGTGDAEAERRQTEREAEAARHREANERREADRVEIAGRLEALGIDPRPVSIRGSVEMDKDTLRRLLDLAERPIGVAGQGCVAPFEELRDGLLDLRGRLGEMSEESGTWGVYEEAVRLSRIAEKAVLHVPGRAGQDDIDWLNGQGDD